MDAARLQSKLNSGYGKAAQRIGYAFDVHRPAAATNPIVAGNIAVSQLNAVFTPRSAGFNFGLTSDYIKPLFHGLFDGTNVKVGDYLYNATHGTYFVIAMQEQTPMLCVQCNNTVSVLRAAVQSQVGVVTNYIGDTSGSETALMTAFPASVIYDARGKNSGAQLPLDEVKPYFTILLPALSGVDIRPSDIITDTNSPVRRYIVTSSERSPLGWRIVARHAVA